MTSRIESAPTSRAGIRSQPNAIPPCGGAPKAKALPGSVSKLSTHSGFGEVNAWCTAVHEPPPTATSSSSPVGLKSGASSTQTKDQAVWSTSPSRRAISLRAAPSSARASAGLPAAKKTASPGDAPLFKPTGEDDDVAVGGGSWTAVHHAFTSPKPEWVDSFETDPGNALAYAYDIVCNGNEIGGGSIRIHRQDVQQRVFDMMGLGAEEVEQRFGWFLDAFAFGAPPHGGIAFGWDRIPALLVGADSIRDVIAFPKSGGGYDPLTGAPAPITAQQRKEAGVDVVPETSPESQSEAATTTASLGDPGAHQRVGG